MQWDNILEALAATLKGDPALVAIYGDRMRYTGTGAHSVPMLEWMLIGDSMTELWAPMTVQIDQWTKTEDPMRASERRLHALLHRETPILFGGITTFLQYSDGAMLASPDRDGYIGRAARFRFTPLRQRYTV